MFVTDKMWESWEASAKILVYHYKMILGGLKPFAKDFHEMHWKDEEVYQGLDETALQYIQDVTETAAARSKFYILRQFTLLFRSF